MPNYAYIVLIPLLPLAGFVVLGLFGRKYFQRFSGVIGTALLLVATALALWVAYGYFFDWGKLNGAYRQIVLDAFSQVAGSLQALTNDAESLSAQQHALQSASASLSLTRQAYAAGKAGYVQVMDIRQYLGHGGCKFRLTGRRSAESAYF